MEETIKFVKDQKTEAMKKEVLAKGFRVYCLKCKKFYKKPPQEKYEDGHGGRKINMCGCGCDLFGSIESIPIVSKEVHPQNWTLVFKKHHAKYCECYAGKIWTGDFDTECKATFTLLECEEGMEKLLCRKSGMRIVILESTEEELQSKDELGSTFLRVPSAD